MKPIMNGIMKLNELCFIVLILSVISIMGCKEKIAGLDEAKVKSTEYTSVEVSPVVVSNDPIPIYSIGKVGIEEEVKFF